MSTGSSVPVFDTDAIRKPKRPLWRRVLRITGRVLAGLVVLVALLVAFLHTPWGKSFVRGRVEKILAKKVNGTVHVGSMDYGFLFGTIELGDIEIRDASGKPAIAVANIDIDLDRSALLDKEVVLNDLTIAGLAVNVQKHADGTSNLTGLFKPSKSKPLSHVKIEKLSVTGSAKIEKADGSTIAVRDLALAGSVDARPRAKELELAIARLAAKVDARGKQLDVAIAGVSVRRSATRIDAEIAAIGAGVIGIDRLAAHVALDKQGDQTITIGELHVDSKQLAALLGKQVVLDDIAMDLSVSGPSNAIVVAGNVKTRETTLVLSGSVDIAAARPRYDIALVGKGQSRDIREKGPAVAGGVKVTIAGAGIVKTDIEAEIGIDLGPTTVNKIAIDGLHAKAFARKGTYELASLDAHGLGFDVTASGTFGADKSLDAKLGVVGNPMHATKVLAAAGIAIPRRVPNIGKLDLAITAQGKVDGELAVQLAPTKLALAGGSVRIAGDAKLFRKKLQVAHTTIALAKLDLAGLAQLAGRPPKARGTLSGNLALTKTPTARDATFDLAVALADKPLAISAKGTATLSSAKATAQVRRTPDGALLATLGATVPLDAKGFAPNGPMKVTLDAPRRELAELGALVNKQLPIAADIAIHAELAGSPAKPTGTITVTSSKGKLAAKLAPSARALAVTLDGSSEFATLHGTLAMPYAFHGKKLDVPALRAGLTVDATIDVPDRPLASLRERLAKLGGNVGGKIVVRGPVKTPSIDANLAWRGYQTAANTQGETKVHASGTPNTLVATIDHGGVQIIANVDRAPERIAIKSQMRASQTPLLPLLPATLASKLAAHEVGRLDWNMNGDVVLVKTAGKLAVDSLALAGTLDVTGGSIAIPKSKRRYHDVALHVRAEPAGVRIEKLELHEGKRELAVSGLLALDKTKPKHVDLSLTAKDWLVFGSDKLGLPDAPRGQASFDIAASVDLTQPVIGVDATVKRLDLDAPDRLERGHYFEKASVSGDVIFVDGAAKAGKLPYAQVVAAAPKHRRPIDVRVHIPNPIRVQQVPLDVMAKGELAITVRDEGVRTRGMLTMTSGTLNLFGRDHELVEGTVAFTDEHPRGWMELVFERQLPDYAKRALSSSAGGARITLRGVPNQQKTVLSGSANGAMLEVMAMYNAGRPMNVAEPGRPASSTVTLPRGDQLFMLTFMASNLPHLLFLDRVTAWSDHAPHVTNVEAEKYTRNARIRAVVRPPTPGRSENELQYDRLLINSDRSALGVGVRAGDRVGGGVGVFWEWSSKD